MPLPDVAYCLYLCKGDLPAAVAAAAAAAAGSLHKEPLNPDKYYFQLRSGAESQGLGALTEGSIAACCYYSSCTKSLLIS